MAKNPSKMTSTEMLGVCRKMYYLGFALLPFIWLVNFMYFLPELRRRPPAELDPKMKIYVWRSLYLSLAFTAVSVTWFIIFVSLRTSWGAAGDILTVVIPKGY